MKNNNNQNDFIESTLLTFVTETKDGEYGITKTEDFQTSRVEILREEPIEPIYFYSFQ